MNIKSNLTSVLLAAMTCGVLLTATGCAVSRGQETVGAYVDDTGITTLVKSRFVENKMVDAAAISVETLNGTVMLSGFAKNATEKNHCRRHCSWCQRCEDGQKTKSPSVLEPLLY